MRVAVSGVFAVLLNVAPSLADPKPAKPAEAPAEDAMVYTVWTGTYVCAQGLTALRLTIESARGGGAAFGHFQFSADPSNPNVPSGDYWMKGTLSLATDGKLAVTLAPDRWGKHPSNYIMVGLTATSDAEQRRLAGSIDHESCTTLALSRVN